MFATAAEDGVTGLAGEQLEAPLRITYAGQDQPLDESVAEAAQQRSKTGQFSGRKHCLNPKVGNVWQLNQIIAHKLRDKVGKEAWNRVGWIFR